MLFHSKKPKREKMARGGSVDAHSLGESKAGWLAKEASDVRSPVCREAKQVFRNNAKEEHAKTIAEIRSMPKPKLQGLADGGPVIDPDKAKDFVKGFKGVFAEGGEVESPEMDMSEMAGDELMEAIHSKDKSKLISAMKALIASCMNDEE